MVVKFYFIRWYIALTLILCNNVGFRSDQSVCLIAEDTPNITGSNIFDIYDKVNKVSVLSREKTNIENGHNVLKQMPTVSRTHYPNTNRKDSIIKKYFTKSQRSLEESEVELIGSGKLAENSGRFQHEAISLLTSVPSSGSSSSSVSSQFDTEQVFVSSLENVTANIEETQYGRGTAANLHSSGNTAEHKAAVEESEYKHECETDISTENPRPENTSIDTSSDRPTLDNDLSELLPKLIVDKHLQQEPSVSLSSEQQEDIPSFREWTEKHLAEEEKGKGENSTNISSSGVKRKTLKKNFASLDCGAKVVAANPEAKLAGSLLSPTKDEYLLSACNSRIWFVVELCEAVQVEMIELANFELFSSSPREFSVSVSDRFPSRDWSSLGQFEARDEKSVQSFHLHPTHFTKYIKVEIHSHYGQEHFCPISLFHVYGTSELEVLGIVDDHPGSENDNIDTEEDLADTVSTNNAGEKDIFGSARDAVINIVRKAAEVLVHSPTSQNIDSADNEETETIVLNKSDQIDFLFSNSKRCITPRYQIICDNCDKSLFDRVFETISCDWKTLDVLSRINRIVRALVSSRVCSRFGIYLADDINRVNVNEFRSTVDDDNLTYSLRFLSDALLTALCNSMMITERNNKRLIVNTTKQPLRQPITTNNTLDRTSQESAYADATIVGTPDVTFGITVDYNNGKPTVDGSDSISSSATTPSSDTFKIPDNTMSYVDIDDRRSFVNDQIRPTKTFGKNTNHRLHDNDSIGLNDTHVKRNVSSSPSIGPIKALPATGGMAPILESNDTHIVNNNKDFKDPDHGAGDVIEDSTSIDTLISELERTEDDTGHSSVPVIINAATAATITNQKPQIQKESVFVRLANRIKTLERNMSLSGQYLEELSRRYKKQVEDMQRLLADVAEERQRNKDRDERYAEDVGNLIEQITALTSTVNALVDERDSWSYKALMIGQHSIIVLAEVLLLIGIMILCRGIPSVELSKRKISVEWSHHQAVQNKKKQTNVTKNRRQSADNLGPSSQHDNTHQRRPSEVAVGIDGATHRELLIPSLDRNANGSTANTTTTTISGSKTENRRKRKKRKELTSTVVSNLEEDDRQQIPSAENFVATSSTLKRSHSEIFHSTAYNNIVNDERRNNNNNNNNVVKHSSNGNIVSAEITDDNDRTSKFVANVRTDNAINFAPVYIETASSMRRKRSNNGVNQIVDKQRNQKKIVSSLPPSASPQHSHSLYSSSSDRDSSTPQTPVKGKKFSGIKKVVKKFF